MNASQKILSELSDDPERAKTFLHNVTLLLSVTQHHRAIVAACYLVGIITGLVIGRLTL